MVPGQLVVCPAGDLLPWDASSALESYVRSRHLKIVYYVLIKTFKLISRLVVVIHYTYAVVITKGSHEILGGLVLKIYM